MTPKRPYFVRAFHEWLEDNQFTPYLMVNANHPDLIAPLQYANEGRLVLAASYQATHNLHIDNDAISFAARFSGISQDLWIPMSALMGIYAKEDPEQCMFFDPAEYQEQQTAPQATQEQTGKSKLRILD